MKLLTPVTQKHAELQAASGRRVPLLVKIAPDMTSEETEDVVRVLKALGVAGIVVSNTTSDREGIAAKWQSEAGGLSGQPLQDRADDCLRTVCALNAKTLNETSAPDSAHRLAVVGVGGVMQALDAQRKWRLGADLIQLYTGFVYKGQPLVEQCITSYSKIYSS